MKLNEIDEFLKRTGLPVEVVADQIKTIIDLIRYKTIWIGQNLVNSHTCIGKHLKQCGFSCIKNSVYVFNLMKFA